MSQESEAQAADQETMAAIMAAVSAMLEREEADSRPPTRGRWRSVMRTGPGQPTFWRSLSWQ